MTDLFQIENQPIPIPDAPVTVTVTDIVGESARDRSGMLHRTVLRRCKCWEFSYRQLREAQRTYLLDILAANTFLFAHPDGLSRCYCKDISADYHDATAGVWKNFRFRVEEV